MNYKEALSCLEDLEVHGMVFGLDRILRLLGELGNPHHRFRSVHIAGTNGKGSTAAIVASILRESGWKTGLYTSPHLARFTERISISGEEIDPGEVARLTEEILGIIRSVGPDFRPTYFEVTTAMAFAHFARKGADPVVVETGLGGRLDATNVVTPLISVITNVGLEHTEILGATLEEVAREKGGIIKSGVEVVTGERESVPAAVLAEICRQKGSRLISAGREIGADAVRLDRRDGTHTFDYRGEEHLWRDLRCPLPGGFQVRNAVVALGAVEGLMRRTVEIPEEAVYRGLASARWPGRLEVVSRHPTVIVDGAHNPHAVQALVDVLEKDLQGTRFILVIGILRDKDIPAVVQPLLPFADELVLTRPNYFRGADPGRLAGEIKRPGLRLHVRDTVPEAVELAVSRCRPGDVVLITGSLYTVGEARTYILERTKNSLKGN